MSGLSYSSTLIIFENGEQVPCGYGQLGQFICAAGVDRAPPVTNTIFAGLVRGQPNLDPRTEEYGPPKDSAGP